MDVNKSLLLQNPRLYAGSTTGLLESVNNLSDVNDAVTAVGNLGLDTKAVTDGKIFQRRMVNRVLSDGATTDRGRILTPGAIGAVAGLPITIEATIPPMSSNPSGTARIIYMGPVSGGISVGLGPLVNAFQLSVTTSGALVAKAYLSGGNDREFLMAGYVATYGNSAQRVTCVFTVGDSSTDPVIHITGVNKSSAFVPNTTGSGTNWASSTFNPVYQVEASDWPAGDAPTARVIIGAYSDAEAVTWTAGGQRPAWAELAGSAVDLNTDTILTSGLSFTTETATSWGGNNSSLSYARAELRPQGDLVNGRKYHLRFTVDAASAISGFNVEVRDGSANGTARAATVVSNKGTVTSTGVTINEVGTYKVTLSPTGISAPSTARVQFGVYSASLGTYTVNAISMIDLGLIDNPIPQPGLTSFDTLGRMSRRNVGHLNVSDNQLAVIAVPYIASGTTSYQLGGGVLLDGVPYRVVSVSGTADASVNLSLGTTTSGTQIVSAQAVTSSGFDIGTFASRVVAASSSLYLTFSASCNGTIKVTLARL